MAFMRNVNQGQRGHPSTSDILAGFADAGCSDARTFQSNGTIVFESDEPARVVELAAEAIGVRSGVERGIRWIGLTELAAIIDANGSTHDAHRIEFTLHGGGPIDGRSPDVVALAAEHRCSLVDTGPGWAVVRNDVDGEGHATPVLERLTGRRATSRGLPTIIRLVARFGE
ncbi:DUF1697 domain-containing protein [Microbacterium sp. NPDC056003]|uniref:DUF1697 domain-containing protein n=1 Tax=Microbacterium sp. NPDC056003 TaxID=3345676 RepID=UPI0035DB85E3